MRERALTLAFCSLDVLLKEWVWGVATCLGLSVCLCILQFNIWASRAIYMKLGTSVILLWSRYRPGVAQRVGRGIAILFHDRGTRRGWVVSSTLRPQFTTGKDPVSVVQGVWWAPGPVWTGRKSRPHLDPMPNHPARSSVAVLTELHVQRHSTEGHSNMVDARVPARSAYVIHADISLKLTQPCSDIYSLGYKITNGRAVKVQSI